MKRKRLPLPQRCINFRAEIGTLPGIAAFTGPVLALPILTQDETTLRLATLRAAPRKYHSPAFHLRKLMQRWGL